MGHSHRGGGREGGREGGAVEWGWSTTALHGPEEGETMQTAPPASHLADGAADRHTENTNELGLLRNKTMVNVCRLHSKLPMQW